MTSPLTAGLIVKRTLPDWPVVDVGAPWHFWIEPAMPPQIWRSATLDVWKSRALQRGGPRQRLVQHGKSRLGLAVSRASQMLPRGGGEVGKRHALFTRALHVGDRLLADLERRCERADEEHRESVEESGELHLGLCGLEQAERHQKSRKDRKSKGGRYSKDRRRRQKQQLNQRRMRKKGAALLERRLNRSEERGGGGMLEVALARTPLSYTAGIRTCRRPARGIREGVPDRCC